MTPPWPRFTLVVAGVATEVGKTWIGAGVLRAARAAGLGVAARKPVQSFDPGAGAPRDAELLAAATGEQPGEVCPPHRSYPVAMAPPMAADVLGRAPIALADLLAELSWPGDVELGLVETVGGVRSPLAHDADSAALARALRPDLVLLVADAGLGTINAVRSSAAALHDLPVAVHLNRFDPADDLHRRNARWLEGDGFELLADPAAAVPRLVTGAGSGRRRRGATGR